MSSLFLLNTMSFEENTINEKNLIEIENKLTYIIHELGTIINYNKELNEYFRYLVKQEILYDIGGNKIYPEE